MQEFLLNNFNPILLVFASYTIGVFGTGITKILGLYEKFEDHNYIGNLLTKRLGVLKFGWLIRKSFMRIFNPKLKFTGKMNTEKLIQLKEDMTFAENNHLFGFIFFQGLIFVLAAWGFEIWQIVSYTIINVVFNLYLVFLQQFNKRKIDRILEIHKRRIKPKG